MKELYFIPEEITYTKRQFQFLLQHLHELEAGCWPEIENEILLPEGGIIEGSEGLKKSKILYKPNPDAMWIANEINARLKLCGRDGQIVKARFADKKSVKECCEMFRLQRAMIFRCCQKCIKFIEGRHRPKSNYKESTF